MISKIIAHVDEKKPHIIRGKNNCVICVLVDYPLLRENMGQVICEAINKTHKETPSRYQRDVCGMIRNFPHHVGSFDADLPETCCPDNDWEQAGFREGWSRAVEAINNWLTDLQKTKTEDG